MKKHYCWRSDSLFAGVRGLTFWVAIVAFMVTAFAFFVSLRSKAAVPGGVFVETSGAENSLNEAGDPLQSPDSPTDYDITDEQYRQIRIGVIGNRGSVSQKWGNYYAGNVTTCGGGSLEKLHPGVDIAEIEDTPVFTPVGGKVVRKSEGDNGSGGSSLSTVAIYNSQANKTYVFLHMKSFNVNLNDTVSAGSQIGTIGKRGANGPHVHYEVRDGQKTSAALCVSGTVNPYTNTAFSGGPTPPPSLEWTYKFMGF